MLEMHGNGRSDLIEWMFGEVQTSAASEGEVIAPAASGLDTYTGIILEPTVEFFTFVIDSIMSVFSSVMTQKDLQFVMVFENELNDLEPAQDAENIGATYTITDMEPYGTMIVNLDLLRYPYFTYSPEEIFAGKIDLLDVNFIDGSNGDDNWLNIRKVISQWYNILRMVAIIGLLSVLIYTGIKIIISSNTKDKAKYKEMIANWFIAVILAFSMHYIMAFILSVIEEITTLLQGLTGAIQVNAGGTTFVTNLIGLARFQLQQNHFTAKVGYLIIYTALVVYTFKFTFVYLKRVLKMAFLTIIAPIVALTYPIDKANDGKAQGFEMWLKEFIYNALLQPMHYILYYILVSSSLTLAVRNPIYGIVALAFMSQAEKLLKKIFGFDKARAGTVGGIAGAFATGAVTSSFINHVRDPLHPFGKGNGSGSSNRSSGNALSNGNYTYYDEDSIQFNEDTTNIDSLLGMNLRGMAVNNNESTQQPGPVSFSGGDFGNREDMINILNQYERNGGNLEDVPDLSTLNDEDLRDLIQDRVIDNDSSFGNIGNNGFWPRYMDGSYEPANEEQSAWSIFKSKHPMARGLVNVGKTLAKPIWDTEKDTRENLENIGENVAKTVAGATVGIAAATVQAGMSITDGKYDPIEGATTVMAGMTGTSAVFDQFKNKKELDPEDKESLEKYTRQWFNSDHVIDMYNMEYAGEGKKRRSRAAKNYVSRGITDFEEQKQAMNFADLIKKERGLDEDEADKVAVATLQYRQGLIRTNNYMVLFDKDKKNKHIDLNANAYVGSASKDSIRRLHEDLIENVRDFDRANR